MATTSTATDWLARHPFDDAKYHLMPAKDAERIEANPNSRLAYAEAKVRCGAHKKIQYVRITPRRPLADGPLPENMCARCASYLDR